MEKRKELWCLAHSHLDVGFTHPQQMLLELQCDYIDRAIELCLATENWPEASRFRWTCEATWPVLKWMETAGEEKKKTLRRLVQENRISVAALPMHTTPGCTTDQYVQYLQQLDEIRRQTGSSITTAINHDVNGQPWTLAPLLLDSGIRFYITGINIHFGGIPFPRPYVFRWETPDGRFLPAYVGEHYSMFNEYLHNEEGDTDRMEEGIRAYEKQARDTGWKEDFLYLTAANPPQADNNSPDADLAALIRRFNEEEHEYTIRFVTPEMLEARLLKNGAEVLDVHAGDWTDYWNFGCASTAREVRVSRRAKNMLKQTEFLECCASVPTDERLRRLTGEAYENALFFDEHTWGAASYLGEAGNGEYLAQLGCKKEFAYAAANQAAYLLGRRMEQTAQNPWQADHQDGICLVNPTGVRLHCRAEISRSAAAPGKKLAEQRIRQYLPYGKTEEETIRFASEEIPPYTVRRIPFDLLKKTEGQKAAGCTVSDTSIETPFYTVSLAAQTGRITQIRRKTDGRVLLNEESEWGFFDLAEERIDPRYAPPVRGSLFCRNFEKVHRNISQWQHDWKAVREGVRECTGWYVQEDGEDIVLVTHSESRAMEWIEQRIRFSCRYLEIGLDVKLKKRPETEPLGIYFVFPLALAPGWECVYDTADTFVRLDEEQLGNACRDYLTVEKSISVFDEAGGVTLACPDAPMVQVGDFQFARENREISRNRNPLLLAWPMNNYWDTNFAASEEGWLQFHYELFPFTKFDRKEAYRAGVQAAAGWAAAAAMECREETAEELLRCDSKESIPIVIRPCWKQDGILIGVKNFGSTDSRFVLSAPGKKLRAAAITDLTGRTLQEVSVKDCGAAVQQTAGAITFVRLQFE